MLLIGVCSWGICCNLRSGQSLQLVRNCVVSQCRLNQQGFWLHSSSGQLDNSIRLLHSQSCKYKMKWKKKRGWGSISDICIYILKADDLDDWLLCCKTSYWLRTCWISWVQTWTRWGKGGGTPICTTLCVYGAVSYHVQISNSPAPELFTNFRR